MVSITITLEDEDAQRIERFAWVNWSEVVREEMRKKELFERYLKKKELSDEDMAFCEKIDWHPVDWLPLKGSFVKRLKGIRKQKGKRFRNVEELRKHIENA